MGEFSRSIDLSRLKEDLTNRVEKALDNTSVPQRMQVLRDLCLVAKASGHATMAEQRVLEEIAGALTIPRTFIAQTLAQNVEPD